MRKWREFEIKLETLTPFRIGGERPIPGTTDVDSPVVRVGDRIVVQSTSLKGAYRAELERYLIDTSYDKANKKWKDQWTQPCIPADERSISNDEKKLVDQGIYKYCCSYPGFDSSICPICYLLGARGLTGFASVPFLNMEIEEIARLQFIGIDRVTGVSAKGRIGKFEVIPEGNTFKGNLYLLQEDDILGWKFGKSRSLSDSNGDKWLESGEWTEEKIIKDLIIDRLQNLQFFGGFKSRGCGRVRITVTPVN
ncbi:MAG: hypothetical protein IBX72_05905 [Nitrospirae bacterium]|nr:hypothetical protein [Nitrospirota bacterium]